MKWPLNPSREALATAFPVGSGWSPRRKSIFESILSYGNVSNWQLFLFLCCGNQDVHLNQKGRQFRLHYAYVRPTDTLVDRITCTCVAKV